MRMSLDSRKHLRRHDFYHQISLETKPDPTPKKHSKVESGDMQRVVEGQGVVQEAHDRFQGFMKQVVRWSAK